MGSSWNSISNYFKSSSRKKSSKISPGFFIELCKDSFISSFSGFFWKITRDYFKNPFRFFLQEVHQKSVQENHRMNVFRNFLRDASKKVLPKFLQHFFHDHFQWFMQAFLQRFLQEFTHKFASGCLANIPPCISPENYSVFPLRITLKTSPQIL